MSGTAKKSTDRAKKWRKRNPEKWREAKRQYRKSHPEKRREKERRYRKSHPEKHIQRLRLYRKLHPEIAQRYRKLHPDKCNKASRQYKKSHPEKTQMQARNRRMRMCKVTGNHTVEQWNALKEKFNCCCANCGMQEPFTDQHYQYLTEDHITPISKGGSNDISNIQPLCSRCNSSKGIS